MTAEAGAGPAREAPGPLTHGLRVISAPAARVAIKIVISAGLLFLVFQKVQLSEPAMLLGGSGWGAILIVWLMQSALPFVQAERWRLIAATLVAKPPFAAAIKNVYIGQFFNQVLPSAIGGDAVRVWKLTRLMPMHAALSSVALDRIVALLAVPVILIFGSGMLAHIVPPGPFRWGLFALMGLAALGLVLLLSADAIPLPVALGQARFVTVLRAMPAAARGLFSNPGCLARTMALSIVIHLGVGTSLWILAQSFDPNAPIAAFLILAPLVTLVTAVPISVGGWGVREGAMVTALGLVGIQPSVALTVSVQFGLIMVVVGLPGGVLAFVDRSGPQTTDGPQRFIERDPKSTRARN